MRSLRPREEVAPPLQLAGTLLARLFSGFQSLPDRRGYRRGCKECQVPAEKRETGREKERQADDMESQEKREDSSGADKRGLGREQERRVRWEGQRTRQIRRSRKEEDGPWVWVMAPCHRRPTTSKNVDLPDTDIGPITLKRHCSSKSLGITLQKASKILIQKV